MNTVWANYELDEARPWDAFPDPVEAANAGFVPLTTDVDVDAIEGFNATGGVIVAAWLRDWVGFYRAIISHPHYAIIDAEADMALRFEMNQFGQAVQALYTPSNVEFMGMRYQYARMKALMSSYTFSSISGLDAIESIENIASGFGVELVLTEQ